MNNFPPDPKNAENTVALFIEQHKKLSKTHKEILYILSSYSRFLGKEIIRQPSTLSFISKSNFKKTQKPLTTFIEETSNIESKNKDNESFLSELRKYKYREFSRLLYKDILYSNEFSETMGELSDLASSIVQTVLNRYCKIYPEAKNNLVIIAMGKLGGRELNLSSDIDLIYLFKDTQDFEQIFKCTENLTTSLSSRTSDGFLYRVDLGLRPGGGKSTIAVSIEGALEHYFYWGDTWERAALIKARPIAGNIKLGRKFISDMQSFVYKRNLDYSSVEDLKNMKSKLDGLHKINDVKLGKGGIREIEFFIHAFQLIYGGKFKQLREQNTLKTLSILRNTNLITDNIKDTLESSYIFLRRTEHFIQIADEIQTHRIPDKPEEKEKLAKRLKLKNKMELNLRLNDITDNISKIYNNLFFEPTQQIERVGKEFWELADFLTEGHIDEEHVTERLKELGFNNPRSALDIIDVLINPRKGGLTQKGRTLSNRVVPALLRNVISSPNPDTSLRNVERFISSVGSKSSLYSVLSENPEICNILSKLFSTSRYLSNFLIKHPEYLDYLTLKGVWKEYNSSNEMIHDLIESVENEDDIEYKLDALRRFKHAETLKLCLRDLNEEVDSSYAGNYISMIAEAELNAGFKLAVNELKRGGKTLDQMAIIGMGKLGGKEMGYNSDIDIIFVYKGKNHEYYSKLGQKLISILSIPTGEGFVFKIDMGLRPSGHSGALVSSLESFKSYHEQSAMLWERQALIKARVITGDKTLGKTVMKTIEDFVYKKSLSENFINEISHLRNRMENELAKETAQKFNIKTGKGGLVDIDFIVQSLQLKYGNEKKNLRKTNTLQAIEALFSENVINKETYNILSSGFNFLKKLENSIRLLNDKSTSEIYDNDFERLTELTMNKSSNNLKSDYLLHTKNIRELYNQFFH